MGTDPFPGVALSEICWLLHPFGDISFLANANLDLNAPRLFYWAILYQALNNIMSAYVGNIRLPY